MNNLNLFSMLSSNQQKFTFTSYVNCTKSVNVEQSALIFDPKLLPGEIGTVSADAFMFPPTAKITEEQGGIPGKLFVTNFKLSFIPYDVVDEQISYQYNRFLRRNDVTLSNIDVIYQIVDKKKKKILPQQKVNSKIDAIYVICKNFRFLKFSFKTKDQGTLIASALARFAFPSRHDLSFAFYYNDIYCSPFKSDVSMFNTKNDWISELKRCGASEWKVVSSECLEPTSMKVSSRTSQIINKSYTLPKFCVIPKCFNEKEFFISASSFCDSRSAFWVYSYGPTGASLVRMGELKSYREGRTIENVTLEKVRNCDPERKSLEFKNLSEQLLPTNYDVRQSYLKLRELCVPENFREFLLQDSKYYSLIDKSGWLKCVSACLEFSLKMSEILRAGTTVVLQESNGREMCCVISSIIQILLDPYFRTLNGFQSLIQKEWVALEHPFSDRLGHTWKQENTASTSSNVSNNLIVNNLISSSSTTADEESPLLLLFLDCIWQLVQQFPEEFEFSQTYLTTIWDSAFMPIFDTFQFNCEYDRQSMVVEKKLILRPIWDWDEQFDEKDKTFFYNPLYSKKPFANKNPIPRNAMLVVFTNNGNNITRDIHNINRSTIPNNRYLEPLFGVSDLQIWQQCYYRWIPIVEIEHGGYPQIDLLHRLIATNISKLQRALETGEFNDLPSCKNFLSRKNKTHIATNEEIFQKNENEALNTNEIEKDDSIDNSEGSNNKKSAVADDESGLGLPIVNSFFPFSIYSGNSSELSDILMHSNEPLGDDSTVDRLMITQIPD
ncbi:myotubularin-related protein 10-B [Condylostylus longicornis]|uniref:myotubularin-related protein 10-B n=1 Tax=Condylostylus longicornis TaxID=2530218 RepID=UPI00244DC206|nr:myotubularin-related protein 10-B [Condylostylus longicornis]